MISVSHKIGRLAEVRMTSPITSDDVVALQREVSAILNHVPGRIVVCADLSKASVLSEDLGDRVARFFRASNARLERSAIIVGSATFFLQVERLLREGPSSARDSARDSSAIRALDPNLVRRASDKGSDPHMARRLSERRAFRTGAEAAAWLDEVLTVEERARLRLFLDGGG